MRETIEVPGMKPGGPYSLAVRANGFLFVAGQAGVVPETGEVGATFELQARQGLENLRRVLEAGGSSLGRVVNTTVSVGDMAQFGVLNALFEEYFVTGNPGGPPARMVMQTPLPRGLLFSIGCVALVD